MKDRRFLWAQPTAALLCVMISILSFGQTPATPVQPSAVPGVPPRLIQFASSLNDASGNPLTDRTAVSFAIYSDQTGGVPLWQETQNVQFSQGHYSVLLGDSTPGGIPTDLFASGQSRWLGVRVVLPGEQEQPRILLASVPYALKAGDADTIGGLPPEAFARANAANQTTTTDATISGVLGVDTSLNASTTTKTSGRKPNRFAPTSVNTVTTLPATCNGGTAGVATDYVMLIGSNGQSVPYVCVRPNIWQVATNPSGTADVRNYGAKCDGLTDDTAAFNAAIASVAPPTYSEQRVYVPNTSLGCVVSQINAANISNRLTIVGDNGGVQFISLIVCKEASSGAGVCIDFTGSSYVTLENIRIQYGSNPPLAVIRMGKSTTGNSGFIHTRNLDVECNGSGYGVYNNGGEVWQSVGDVFEGCSFPVVLSSAPNCGSVSSPFATCPSTFASMTNVHFFDPFFGSDVSGGFGLMFDPEAGGSIEDVNVFGGYAQTVNGTIALFGDKPGSAGGIRGFAVIGLRDEPQGSSGIAPFMKFANELDEADIHAKFAPVAAPSSPVIQLGAVQAASFNVQPADSPTFYANPFMTCSGSVTATVAYLYTKSGGGALPNNCPGDTEYYNGISVNSGIVSSGQTTTVTALGTPTTITGTAANSGILVVRDDTIGGSALFLIDPNFGSQLITSQITGLASAADITFSGGVWKVTLTSGSVPRILKTIILHAQ